MFQARFNELSPVSLSLPVFMQIMFENDCQNQLFAPIDWPTDRVAYRVACMRLKIDKDDKTSVKWNFTRTINAKKLGLVYCLQKQDKR